MSGQLSLIPASLPPGLYEQAGGNPQVRIPSHSTGTGGSFSPTAAGVFPQTRSALQQQYTGQGPTLQPNYTGASPRATTSPRQATRPAPGFTNSAFGGTRGNGPAQWDVTTAEKATADRFFDNLDSQRKGYIEGDVAVPFMLESKLPGDDLAQVWCATVFSPLCVCTRSLLLSHRDLADINRDGRLTRDGFAVAMHLIQGKLAGKDIPTVLPATLIPPSTRMDGASPFYPSPAQDLLGDDTPPHSATLPQQTASTLPTISPQQQQGSSFTSSPPRPWPSGSYDPFRSSCTHIYLTCF
jgi:epidermal growth factor receptor substrate 15